MSIHVALHHRTRYQYDRLTSLGPQTIRLRPAPHARTRILSYSLQVRPEKHFINWQQDPQSNYLARVVFPESTRELVVDVDLVAEMAVFNPFDFFLEPHAERFPFQYESALDHELEPFRRRADPKPKFTAYYERISKVLIPDSALGGGDPRPRTMDFLVRLNQLVWKDVNYLIRLEPGVQTSEETLTKGSGSCRDSSWLLCQLARQAGLAARFVSGYLIQLAPDVKSLDGPSGTERDFTDLHAWCEVYLPGAGWIGLDPTSGLLAGEGHIPLAATPDPSSAAPISGLTDECEVKFEFEMGIKRIYETPRVTKPYTDQQWTEIEALGHLVDDDLKKGDCRLTMGGEPTFVSIDDMDGPEWNTLALGPMKRRLADDLIKRLKRRFSTGALLHYGQGKWYPGEPLPRWALACYWRKDGLPIWKDEALFANESTTHSHGTKQAEEFIYLLADRLGCGGKFIIPAYEDAWYYLWKERRLPSNVDPLQSKLGLPEERARLAEIFEKGLDKVVGYTLPIRCAEAAGDAPWSSGPWFLRPERCYLLPGDSPLGFRLPLDSLPWVSEKDFPYLHQWDPLAERPPLTSRPDRQRFVTPPGKQPANMAKPARFGPKGGPPGIEPSAYPAPRPGESAGWVIRTALCVEPRDGCLHVFMPPLRDVDDYFNCMTAVEDTARTLGTPVVIEGYAPPFDPRLHVIKVTPDPGVIEVNIHPANNWAEMVKHTEGLDEDARQSRLCAEKFMVDGRHTGTGGGNHIVIGGATPSDSPLLRRPDLLRSLLGYWHNHPALSYLFSGLFIGPTSQSPRLDEARNDSLHELEIAFQQIPETGSCPPWLVDRIFRHLLTDSTGNTHRAEFCIDKLYSPDSSTGRLGLLEMRAFEMPPHARMSLAQQVLLRSLIAKFWKQPYRTKLVRWKTDIHDRWMLPHFVWGDLGEVVEDLQASGYPLKREWFAPHLEFRFPRIGDLEVKNIALELRQALEPWHVLGEEGSAGSTVRYVDSSVERLQVKAQGLVDTRHIITVGGTRIPLHPTGVNGEYIAGVRYRAWQPPNCLHPTVGVHAPLVFDIVDTWNNRSIGGCTYHVMHPGGRSYGGFPVNAYEAESRRLARFFRLGHTPGPMIPRVVEPDRFFPFTLDLRTT